ncbi:hypothetical protein M3201_24310 [Paenibacillus motobuensis]|nr:hypothetical protein [Paenibacillus lutimineralis]MCM3649889.1 hypothetical protein [Paenibacillus motobuensis]
MVEMAFQMIFFIVPPYAFGFDETALLDLDAGKNHFTSKRWMNNPPLSYNRDFFADNIHFFTSQKTAWTARRLDGTIIMYENMLLKVNRAGTVMFHDQQPTLLLYLE